MKKEFKKIIATVLALFYLVPVSIAEAGMVELTAVEDEGHDHTTVYDEIDGYLKKMGYSDNNIIKSVNLMPNDFMERLPNRDIVVTRSHGGHFIDDTGNSIGNYLVLNGGNVYNSDIEELEAGALSGAVLLVYVGCHTASGGVWSEKTRNLVVASTEKGAMTAIGFTESIACTGANTWTKYFFKYLADGQNIDKATNNAVTKTKNKHSILNFFDALGIDSMLYRGAWDYTFVD